jgi:hypothetical protein
MHNAPADLETLARDVRLYVFREAAGTGRVPQAPQISAALGRPESDVRSALQCLAEGRVLILAPNTHTIWAADPFCAVPSGFKVHANGRRYWGICLWDALGIPAALGADGVVSATCGDCGEPMTVDIRGGRVARGAGFMHLAVPAREWWDNIGFT